MYSKDNNQSGQMNKKGQIHVKTTANGHYEQISLSNRRSAQRPSIVEPPDLTDIKKASQIFNGTEYQLIPVEIEKEAEIGLVLGQIEGEQYVFIDEILPNGMIEMHGILKEGDYLIQAGTYNLSGVDITTALVLVERAYEEGRKAVAFVAARPQKSDTSKDNLEKSAKRNPSLREDDRKGSRARSFVEYENEEEDDYLEAQEKGKPNHLRMKNEDDDTRF
ncbi:hypothetical protein I4U23_007970 [Adineta vaga]|nr:hypothetical protein I4U23_007970 [Adineta vaga]